MNHNQEWEMSDGAHTYGGTFAAISGSRHRQTDERTLARLGKKQVLKVCQLDSSTALYKEKS